MYQGIEYDIDEVVPALLESGLMSSLCTIVVSPGVFGDSGAPDPTAPYTPVEGLTLIPCTSPPLSYGKSVQPSELKSLVEIMDRDMLHVLLAGYFPAITTNHRAVIGKSDGMGGIASPETYDIVGVEWDSQNRLTRLAVQLATI